MNIHIGSSVLCVLTGSQQLTERIVAQLFPDAVLLVGGDSILRSCVYAVISK